MRPRTRSYIYIYIHAFIHTCTRAWPARSAGGGRSADTSIPSPQHGPKEDHRTVPCDIIEPYSTWLRCILFGLTGGGQTRNAKGVKRVTLSISLALGSNEMQNYVLCFLAVRFLLLARYFVSICARCYRKTYSTNPRPVGALARDPLSVRNAADTGGNLAKATGFGSI